MDALTQLIRSEIKRQYKSVRKFAIEMEIPPSTLISALNKGIGGTSFDTVVSICEVLGIKTVLMGFGLEADAIHSPNESFSLDMFRKGIEAVVEFHMNYSK